MKPTKLQACEKLARTLNFFLHSATHTDLYAELSAALAAYEAAPDEPEQCCMWAGCETSAIAGEFYCQRHAKDGVLKAKATPDEKPGADWIETLVDALYKDDRVSICWDGCRSEERDKFVLREIITERRASAQPAAVSARDSERLDWLAKTYGEAGNETASFYKETIIFDQAFERAKKGGLGNAESIRRAVDAAIEAERTAKAQP